jgi:hypothetical protein
MNTDQDQAEQMRTDMVEVEVALVAQERLVREVTEQQD